MRRWLLLPIFALLVVAACKKEAPASPDAPAARAAGDAPEVPAAELDEDVVLPVVSADAKNLLFTWLNEYGRVKASSKLDDVPEELRERVLVTDLSLSSEQRQAHRYAFFTDLTAPGKGGRYPVVAVSRYDAARGEGLKVQLAPAPEGAVIVYSAEWCGFCKKAKRWLASKEVPFVERDVEKQPGVAEELKEKLAAAKVRGGGVPVIDWDGTIIVGFDQRRLEKLLAERGAAGGD
jgi:glutaredoxin